VGGRPGAGAAAVEAGVVVVLALGWMWGDARALLRLLLVSALLSALRQRA
jgi:hypothetical protein